MGIENVQMVVPSDGTSSTLSMRVGEYSILITALAVHGESDASNITQANVYMHRDNDNYWNTSTKIPIGSHNKLSLPNNHNSQYLDIAYTKCDIAAGENNVIKGADILSFSIVNSPKNTFLTEVEV